jgi:hypothetical protein
VKRRRRAGEAPVEGLGSPRGRMTGARALELIRGGTELYLSRVPGSTAELVGLAEDVAREVGSTVSIEFNTGDGWLIRADV